MTSIRTAVMTVGALGGLSGAAWGLLSHQSRHARVVIGRPTAVPPNADGVYHPSGAGPFPGPDTDTTRFAVLGDSSAAGLGAEAFDELPGVRAARGLAEESGRPVWLTTTARVGARTADLAGQVDRVLSGGVPDLCLVIIGANDVSTRASVSTTAAALGAQVRRLTGAGCQVVVGTCPDLGAIQPIPQPLRSVAHRWSRALAGAQRRAVRAGGGHPVALGDLLSPEFLARPADLFSADRFHPNAAGYEAAVAVLLPALCEAAGVWGPLTPDRHRVTHTDGRPGTLGTVGRVARRLWVDPRGVLSPR